MVVDVQGLDRHTSLALGQQGQQQIMASGRVGKGEFGGALHRRWEASGRAHGMRGGEQERKRVGSRLGVVRRSKEARVDSVRAQGARGALGRQREHRGCLDGAERRAAALGTAGSRHERVREGGK